MAKEHATSRSLRSIKSTKTIESDHGPPPKTLDFDELLTTGCAKFSCARKTVVQKDFQLDDFLKTMKRSQTATKSRKSTINTLISVAVEDLKEDSESKVAMLAIDDNTVIITAIYDSLNRFCEIMLQKQKVLPRVVMQILGILAPHYPHLMKLTFRSCRLDGYTMYEMCKFLPLCSITQVCLDESRLSESNYATLLDEPSRITSLSLCRCKISDDDCKEIASRLHFLRPAELHLSALNLSSNQISDAGAQSIGEALKTNRRLRYLNLANNWISDVGAGCIFQALVNFYLTYDDIIKQRRRQFSYLRTRHDVYTKFLMDLDLKSYDDAALNNPTLAASRKLPKRTVRPKKQSEENAQQKADILTNQVMGEYSDPFTEYNKKIVNEHPHCVGNMVLCYLNLSYNNLTYCSVEKLRSTLRYQRENKRSGETGLLKVVIEGNPTPVSCDAYQDIQDLLQTSIGMMRTRMHGKV